MLVPSKVQEDEFKKTQRVLILFFFSLQKCIS
ncbi:hypothetical protein ACFW04_005643 [Cataglyphis niger]